MFRVSQLIGFGGSTALPAIENNASSSGTASTTNVATLPSGIVSGDLVYLVLGSNNNTSATFPSGWTIISGGGGADRYVFAWKRCDGTEGTSVSITRGTSCSFSAVAIRVSGVPASYSPNISSMATAGSANPDSGSVSSSYGLYISAIASSTDGVTISSVPSGYIAAGSNNAQSLAGMATKTSSALTDDPGPWTLNTIIAWYAWTVGI